MRAMEERAEQGREAASRRVVGKVVELWRYPVKSMAGEPLREATGGWHGLAGDRRWAFVRPGLERSNFPWLTARELPELFHYRPRFAEEDPEQSTALVRTPSGGELDVHDPALAAELGEGVRVIKQNRGVFDTAPLSLLSTQSVASLGALIGAAADAPIAALRFRPNLLIEAAGADAAAPFPEDAWVDATLWLGELAMRLERRDSRCVMVNVDPVTTARNPAVLRTIAQQRQSCLGVYGSTVQPGRVRVGDPVTIARDR
jgi:uncharacterized protein